jgi:hypothetical protein
VPLNELYSNGDDAKYKMYPNAYRFIGLLSKRLALAKEKKLPHPSCLGNDSSEMNACQLMKQVTVTHDVMKSVSGLHKPVIYYISEPLKYTPKD